MTWKCTNTPKGDNKLYSDAKGVVPSLDLRFAEGKNLNDYMTGQNLITFSRPDATTCATYVDSNGIIQTAAANVPRFDHDPTTGESLGLLIEESRTNLVTYSEQFDNAAWVKSGDLAVTADQTVAPDATTTADLLTCSNAGLNRVTNLVSVSASTDYTATVFVKSGDRTHLGIRLYIFGGTVVDLICNFEFASGTFSYISGPGTLSATPYPNGWYRLTITIGTGNNTSLEFRLGGAYINEATGTTAYLWGAQLEVGSFPTSYIPTTTTALTRSADAASITGSNFSSWYNQSEGTVFGEFSQYAPGGKVFTISDNTAVNFITVQTNSIVQKAASANVFVSSSNIGRIDSVAAFVANSTIKFAHGVSNGYRALSAQGETAVTAANPPTLPVVDTMYLGANDSGVATFSNGTISRLTYFPDRLPDAILQAITAS
jgi:hypothetical protein